MNCDNLFKVKFTGEFYKEPVIVTDDGEGNVTISGTIIITNEDNVIEGGENG
jgi:hypothetical protein